MEVGIEVGLAEGCALLGREGVEADFGLDCLHEVVVAQQYHLTLSVVAICVGHLDLIDTVVVIFLLLQDEVGLPREQLLPLYQQSDFPLLDHAGLAGPPGQPDEGGRFLAGLALQRFGERNALLSEGGGCD